MAARRSGTVAAGALVAVAHAGPGLCAWSPALRRALGVADRLADAGAVALTFDDGPHAQGTPATLAILAAAGARATFFLTAEQVERDPAVGATAADIAARAADGLSGGEIVLLHDADHYAATGSWRAMVGALPAILDRIAAARLRCVSIGPGAPMDRAQDRSRRLTRA